MDGVVRRVRDGNCIGRIAGAGLLAFIRSGALGGVCVGYVIWDAGHVRVIVCHSSPR